MIERILPCLEHYIYTQQAKTYKFWSKQDPELRKLFVIDTIILNEVGGTPDFKDLEKSEVLRSSIIDRISSFTPQLPLMKTSTLP